MLKDFKEQCEEQRVLILKVVWRRVLVLTGKEGRKLVGRKEGMGEGCCLRAKKKKTTGTAHQRGLGCTSVCWCPQLILHPERAFQSTDLIMSPSDTRSVVCPCPRKQTKTLAVGPVIYFYSPTAFHHPPSLAWAASQLTFSHSLNKSSSSPPQDLCTCYLTVWNVLP